MEVSDRLLTSEEVSEILKIGVLTIQRMEKAGKFPQGVRVGFGKQTTRYRLSDINSWIASLAEPYKADQENV